jgi:molybdopterin converting factor small subunit
MRDTLDIMLFSVLRDRIGEAVISVKFVEEMTGADLLDQVAARYPLIASYRSVIRLAVNQEYSDESISLSITDEVALIIPVSGG